MKLGALLGFVVVSASFFACAEPPADPNPKTEPAAAPTKSTKAKDKDLDVTSGASLDPVEAADCTDSCTEGAKRCLAAFGARTEVCTKDASSGCLAWVPGTDCGAGTSCDRTTNDGTCTAPAGGCLDDAGCSAQHLGAQTCAGARSRIQCAKVGACYQWIGASSCSPDETCSAGTCGAPACTNACTLGALQCTGSRSRQSCTMAASGCTVWTATTGCSPDEQCSAGTCE